MHCTVLVRTTVPGRGCESVNNILEPKPFRLFYGGHGNTVAWYSTVNISYLDTDTTTART